MRGKRLDEILVAECIRLRVQERLSNKEISNKTGIAPGTLFSILHKIPLTHDEMKQKFTLAHTGQIGKLKYRGDESKYYRMVKDSNLTRQDKAKIAEAAVLFRLCLKKFIVYGSPFDGDKADWIIESLDFLGKTYRIQVKWTKDGRPGYGMPSVTLRCMEKGKLRRYKKGDFDFIVGYCLFNDTAYVYSFDELKSKRASVAVSESAAEAWDKIKPT
jgi:hypothetical protein